MNQQFENSVRDMLERRSRDVSEASLTSSVNFPPIQGPNSEAPGARDESLTSSRTQRSSVNWARAAAVILVATVTLGVGIWSTREDSNPSEIELVNTTPSTVNTTTTIDAKSETTGTLDSAVTLAVRDLDLAGLARLLPSSVDLLEGPPVLSTPPDMDAPSIVLAYLEQRLPDLSASIEQVEMLDTLTLFRWQDTEVPEASGYIVVRIKPFQAGVVASFADRVIISDIERSVDGLQGSIASTGAGEFVIEVVPFQDASRSALATATASSLTGPEAADLTASVQGRVELDRIDPPRPLNIRIIEFADAPLAITEIVVGVVGFSEPCGVEPPIAIEVGDVLRPLEAIPEQALPNQLRWIHEGDDARLEIRWPADPTLTTRFRLPLDDSAPGSLVQRDAATQGASAQTVLNEVVLVLVNKPADPCSMVQIDVSGPEHLSDAWSAALSAQWQFGYGLNVEEVQLDPDPSSDEVLELIVGTTTHESPPTIPIGACDGLPDEPPRQGSGNNTSHPTPEQALADFVENQPDLDPPLPTTGYHQFEIGDTNIVYVYDPDRPIVVVSVSRDDEGWSIANWEASPC